MEYFDWSAHQADVRPNKIAIRDTDTGLSLSYAELEKGSCALAGYLQSVSVQKGDRVAILSNTGPHCFSWSLPAANSVASVYRWGETGKVLKRDLRERYVEAGAAAIS